MSDKHGQNAARALDAAATREGKRVLTALEVYAAEANVTELVRLGWKVSTDKERLERSHELQAWCAKCNGGDP